MGPPEIDFDKVLSIADKRTMWSEPGHRLSGSVRRRAEGSWACFRASTSTEGFEFSYSQ
jgi:hypothetical protein